MNHLLISNFLNRNRTFQLILLLPLLGGVVYFLHTNSIAFDLALSPFIALLFPAIQTIPMFLTIMTIIVLCLTLILWQLLFRKSDIFNTVSYYPSVFYLLFLLSSGICRKSLFSIIFLFIVLLLLFINSNYTQDNVKGKVFISGILIGVLSFFNLSAILLLFFLIGSLITHRFSLKKDMVLAFFGFILPVIYFLSYYFLTDQFGKVIEAYSHLSFFGFAKSLTTLSVFQLVRFILLFVILSYLFIRLRLLYVSKLIMSRRYLISIDAMSIVLLFMLFFSNISFEEWQLYVVLPFTAYFSLIIREKRHWIPHSILIIMTFFLL